MHFYQNYYILCTWELFCPLIFDSSLYVVSEMWAIQMDIA